MTLASLKPGDVARVTAIADDSRLMGRLSSLGVLPESQVALVKVAPLGDPITIRVDDQTLAIRRLDASAVTVESL